MNEENGKENVKLNVYIEEDESWQIEVSLYHDTDCDDDTSNENTFVSHSNVISLWNSIHHQGLNFLFPKTPLDSHFSPLDHFSSLTLNFALCVLRVKTTFRRINSVVLNHTTSILQVNACFHANIFFSPHTILSLYLMLNLNGIQFQMKSCIMQKVCGFVRMN